MLVHKHLLVRAEISNPISNESTISDWLKNLISDIGMKILYGPVSVYCDKKGNQGITAFSLIETSHVALHIWDEGTPAMLQLDVYTCSELETDLVLKSLDLFHPLKIDYKFLDREKGFIEVENTPKQVIERWISRISIKHEDLGGHSICPFAKLPEIRVVERLSIGEFSSIGDRVVVYVENGLYSSYEDLENLCRILKSLNPNYVFLPDHPQKKTYIKEHETGNGVFPCIIVQPKVELDSARSALSKTNYYDHWDSEYLDEIRSFD